MDWSGFGLSASILFLQFAEGNAGPCTDAFRDLVVETGPVSAVPHHFNWFMAGADRSSGAALGLLEPLFVADPVSGKVSGWLATEAEWVNSTTLRLHLRRNVSWSDGEPFTAADVAFTLQTAMTVPGLDGLHMARIRAAVSDVRVEDPRHVRVSLHPGQESFVADVLTAGAQDALAVVPEHVWQGIDPTRIDATPWPLGTGPYLLDASDDISSIWARNPNWWGVRAGWHDLPAPERLIWRAVAADEDRARNLTRGCTDVATGFSPGMAAGLIDIAPTILAVGDDPRWFVSPANWQDLPSLFPESSKGFASQASQGLLYRLQSDHGNVLTLH